MLAGLSRFVGLSLVVHVSPGYVFKLGGLRITDSIFYGWICSFVIIVFLIVVARMVKVRPRRSLIQLVEAAVQFISNLVESGFEEKERAKKYVPYFVTLFLFLIITNWLGLIPGVGESITYNGGPLLRPFTGDLNATLSAGIVTMLVVYISSIREAGFRRYMKHFFIGSPLNPLYLILGLVEILTDLTRVISLSIRLFLNVTIGEIVIAVFTYLGQAVAPLTATPFTLLELFVGALQAYIFVILSIMYLAIAVNHSTGHDILTDEQVPETIRLQPEEA